MADDEDDDNDGLLDHEDPDDDGDGVLDGEDEDHEDYNDELWTFFSTKNLSWLSVIGVHLCFKRDWICISYNQRILPYFNSFLVTQFKRSNPPINYQQLIINSSVHVSFWLVSKFICKQTQYFFLDEKYIVKKL